MKQYQMNEDYSIDKAVVEPQGISRLEKLTRKAAPIAAGIYLLTTVGCASYTVNGVRFDEDKKPKYAESGEVMTDAGSKEKKKWYQTTIGKIGIVLGLGLAGWGIYELTEDDGTEEAQTSTTPPPEKPPGGT